MKSEAFPRRFGPYVLMKPLGHGGMGSLCLALHGARSMEKLCVVKTALPHLTDRSYLQRFRDEAQVVVRLSHGNLVTVFDAGEIKGELFLAMEFIEGKDLRAVWNRCAQKGIAFSVPVAVQIVKELARGLAYAHAFEGLSLVHRDVSPPNVLLSYSGEVKLTDFGLATSTLKLEKTAPGVVYGKLSYMAPEQARAEPLDARTDLYSAGIILWELLTGRQLFPPQGPLLGDGSDADQLERVRQPQILAPSRRAARVPAELDEICTKALTADPALRYQAGEELRSALASFLAKAAPATDGAQVSAFLRALFGDRIDKERSERERLIEDAAELLDAPRAVSRPGNGASTGSAPRASTPEPASGAPETDEVSRLVGSIVAGRYRIKRLIGEGGMGRVYEAEHIEIGRRVAVKVLHPAYTRTPDVVERFRREARAASKIGHPNVVTVTDSGTTADGSFFFVMEYIDGIELGLAIHQGGPLAVSRALKIAEQMCEALQAAHVENVIHRDLKPENILLITKEGKTDFVKVLDFGIAKSAELEESERVGGRRLTRPGMAIGTPEYMAPEQAAGRPADPRSDIYAVGSIIYEMITGVPPYEGENVMEVLHKKATGPPRRLADLRPDVPVEVEALVDKAMARAPGDRPETMGELAQAIRAAATSLGAMPAAPRERTSPLFAGTVYAGMALPARVARSRRALVIAASALLMAGTLVIIRVVSSPAGMDTAGQAAPSQGPPPVAAGATAAAATEQPPVASLPAPGAPPGSPEGKPAPAAEAEDKPQPQVLAVRSPGPPALAPAAGKQLLGAAQGLLKAGRYGEAREAFGRLLASGRQRGKALHGLASIAFQRQQYEEAASRAREAGRAGAGVEARLLLGDALFRLEKYAEAEQAYTAALKLDPGNHTARRGLENARRRIE